jgi:DNA-binding transcriptional LysR family regulator
MRFDKLDLNLLVALDTLIERCNVSRAAQDLCLSQSAMSGALNRLREYFDDELLVQSGRKMLLTPRAKELSKPVREALIFVRRNITTLPRFDPTISERCFKIIASDYAHQVLVAELLRQTAREAPRITFKIESPDFSTVERFERGEFDLMIAVDSPFLETQVKHPQMTLFEDEEVVICCSENEVCRDGITAEEFSQLGHVVVNFGPTRSPAVAEAIYERERIERNVEVVLPSFSHLPAAVVGTQRLATMHRRQAIYFAKLLPIKILPMPLPMPKVREIAIWHKSYSNDPGLIWLRERIMTVREGIA